MNEPVPAGASGIALGCGASLPRHKMDGFAGSLGEHGTGRHGTARHGGSLPAASRPPFCPPGGARTCGLGGPRGAGAGGDAVLAAPGGREESEEEEEGGDASAKSGQLQTICCESSGCTCLLCSVLPRS